MTIRQKYSRQEYIFGLQWLTVLISDKYGELFLPSEIIDTQIFNFESIKQDLELEDGSFAVDEMTFSVSHTSCKTADDMKALYFVLNAASLEVNRYVAIYFGEDLITENCIFLGKIESKISGDDKYWKPGLYQSNISPKRDYKLSALSFDISILDQCKMTSKILDDKGTPVDNIYARLANNDWADVKQIFDWRKAYGRNYSLGDKAHRFAPLGNLYKTLRLYLDKAQAIILEIQKTPIQFDLIQSSLGIKTFPITYTLANEYTWKIKAGGQAESVDHLLELKLDTQDRGSDWSSPFIHRRMIDPSLGHTGNSTDKDWEENMASNEKTYSFKALNSVSDLLFGIARSLGCYLKVAQTGNGSFSVEFISRKGMIDEDYTFIIGATDASLDTSSILSDEAQEYYAVANNYAVDGIDSEMITESDKELPTEPSQSFKNASDQRKSNEEKYNTKSERLLLSTSATLSRKKLPFMMNDVEYDDTPLNISTGTTHWSMGWISPNYEHLHTGIYVTLPVFEQNFISYLGAGTQIWRPASSILVKCGDEERRFKTLTEYVNVVTARDKQYYETEYEMTVPFWNGFAKSENGSSANWRNIKLGSKIRLGEKVQRFEPKRNWDSITSDSAWIYVTHTNHGLETGDIIEVYGVSPNDFCTGGIAVTVTDDNNFYYENITGYVGETDGGWYLKRNEWAEDVTVYREYAVTSVERNLQKPETKIKLQNTERFAYGYWEGPPPAGLIFSKGATSVVPNDTTIAEGQTKGFTIDSGTILVNDAVIIMDNGKICKATAESANWGRIRGIALNGGSTGDVIQVQMSGIVKSDTFTFTNINTPIFVRTNATGSNLSQSILQDKTAAEDMIIFIGKPISSNSFLINIMEIVIES